MSLSTCRPSRLHACKTCSSCRCPFVPSPTHCGALPAENVGMRRSHHAYCRVTASGMLRWAEGMPCGTGVQQTQLHHASRTCGCDYPSYLRTSPLCHHALVPFGFPHQVRGYPKGHVCSLPFPPVVGILQTPKRRTPPPCEPCLHLSAHTALQFPVSSPVGDAHLTYRQKAIQYSLPPFVLSQALP
jgi:hypothetical protein